MDEYGDDESYSNSERSSSDVDDDTVEQLTGDPWVDNDIKGYFNLILNRTNDIDVVVHDMQRANKPPPKTPLPINKHTQNIPRPSDDSMYHYNFEGWRSFPPSPRPGPEWSTNGTNGRTWSLTNERSNSGTTCIKSPNLSTCGPGAYSDAVLSLSGRKDSYISFSVFANTLVPYDKFTLIVNDEHYGTVDTTTKQFKVIVLKLNAREEGHEITFRYEYNPFRLKNLPESTYTSGSVFIDDVYLQHTSEDLELPESDIKWYITHGTDGGYVILPRITNTRLAVMDYIQYITHETNIIVRDIEDFKVFTEQRYKYHPLHQHYELVKSISPKVLAILSKLRGIVRSSWESGSNNDDKIIKEAINFAAVQLISITKSTRALIVVLEGNYYSKLHATKVAMDYPKQSTQRLAVINELVKGGYVPSEKDLHAAIQCRESETLVDEKWASNGQVDTNNSLDCNGRRVGVIYLAVLPVKCFSNGDPDITTEFYSPPMRIDISTHIGQADPDFWADRLYFSPRQFPTPANLNDASKDEFFGPVKQYIIQSSKQSGSPVACNGGRKDLKQFVCQVSKNKKRRIGTTDSFEPCEFQFVVKWDHFGYYIHLYNCPLGCSDDGVPADVPDIQ